MSRKRGVSASIFPIIALVSLIAILFLISFLNVINKEYLPTTGLVAEPPSINLAQTNYVIGFFDPVTAKFILKRGNDAGEPYIEFYFGAPNDVPIAGDWDGNGRFDVGVKRGNSWYLDYNNNDKFDDCILDKCYTFGSASDTPITGKWAIENSKWGIGVKRANSNLYVIDSDYDGILDPAATDKNYFFGLATDIPISGDWNQDGKWGIGVKRANSNNFFIDFNENWIADSIPTDHSYYFGLATDIPISGDWDGSPFLPPYSIGVKRASSNYYFIDYDGNGISNNNDKQYNIGEANYKPITGTWEKDRTFCSRESQICNANTLCCSGIGLTCQNGLCVRPTTCTSNAQCSSTQFCEFSAGSCSGTGTCKTKTTQGCPEIYNPICGCDGITYGNDCERLVVGISKKSDGVCACKSQSQSCSEKSQCCSGLTCTGGTCQTTITTKIDSIGVYRPSSSRFILKNSIVETDSTTTPSTFGTPNEQPLIGDWDGDGNDEIGIYRNSTTIPKFILRLSNGSTAIIIFTGSLKTDLPVVGDWNGDGIDTVGFYRYNSTPTTLSTFYLRNSNSDGAEDTKINLGRQYDTPIIGDLDGNNIDDIGVYRSSTGRFYLRQSNGTLIQTTLGSGRGEDMPVMGDLNKDKIDTIGIYRPSSRTFYMSTSNTEPIYTLYIFVQGIAGDKPLIGHWNSTISTQSCNDEDELCTADSDCCSGLTCTSGTCQTTITTTKIDSIGVYRPSSSRFLLRNSTISNDNLIIYSTLGIAGDKPLIGDWDGDGNDEIGIYRNSTTIPKFILRLSNGSTATIIFTGSLKTDLPVVGDWNGDGIDTVGFYRYNSTPTTLSTFYLRNSNSDGAEDTKINLGRQYDLPIVGNINENNNDEIGIYRPSSGTFYLSHRNGTITKITFGNGATDKPIMGDWNKDKIDTIGVYRPLSSTFSFKNSNLDNDPLYSSLTYGISGDLPVFGHWNSTISTQSCNDEDELCTADSDCCSDLICDSGTCQSDDDDNDDGSGNGGSGGGGSSGGSSGCILENRSCGPYYGRSCCSGLVCDSGKCIEEESPQTTSCSNLCSPEGSKQCYGENTYQICDNYDNDGCLEWGSSTNCQQGYVCEYSSGCIPKSQGEVCGNAYCNPSSETQDNCPEDCIISACNNNGICNDFENEENCPVDCFIEEKTSIWWYIIPGIILLAIIIAIVIILLLRHSSNDDEAEFKSNKEDYFYKTK